MKRKWEVDCGVISIIEAENVKILDGGDLLFTDAEGVVMAVARSKWFAVERKEEVIRKDMEGDEA